MRTQAILYLSLVYLALLAPAAEAGRPLVVDDAGTVAPHHLEMTLAFSHGVSQKNEREQIGPITSMTYGLTQAFELGMSIQRIRQEIEAAPRREGFEDLHLNAKYRLAEQDDTFPALSLSFDLRVPTASREKDLSPGKTDESFLLIATKKWTNTVLHLNLGYSVVNSNENLRRKNRLGGGVALEWLVSPDWTIVGEIFGFSRPIANANNEIDCQIGFTYAITPALAVDSAVGRSLRSSGNAFKGTVGITWTFDTLFFLSKLR